MGRKKKTDKKAEAVKSVKKQTIGYQGKISVSVKRGGRTIVKKDYHNSGMPNLFRYMANALAGNIAPELRPAKIKLFKLMGADLPAPKDFIWPGNVTLSEVSPYVLFDSTPVIRAVTDGQEPQTRENVRYDVTFHFRIPSSYIASSDTSIYLVGLYPNNATDKVEDVSAYYLFANEGETEWEPLKLDEGSGDFSIVIEWTMSIGNGLTIID